MEDIKDLITIRPVQESDMSTITAIYADEVLTGVSSWEETPPSLEEMTTRKNNIVNADFPFIVAQKDGNLLGYSYASAYRPRIGYRFTVENSIYILDQARGTGVGRMLLEHLFIVVEHLSLAQNSEN